MKTLAELETQAEDAEGIVFDFGGVISVSPMSKWEHTLYPYCASLGLSREAVQNGFRDYRKLWDGDALSFEDMYRKIFAANGLTPPSDAALAEIRRLDAASWVDDLRDDTLALMRRLKAKGKRLGVLSNMSSDFFDLYYAPRCAAYRALIEVEVISGHERLCKPEPTIYSRVEKRFGLPPTRLLFFDDFKQNVLAARACGWQAEVYPAS